MPTRVRTTVTELPESRVRVEAEVPAEEVERRLVEAARALGRELKLPGFRKGKVPPPVVIQRMGREAVLDEAVRSSLGRWYLDAIAAAGVATVGEPEVDLGDLPGEGRPLTFSVEIGVRPVAELGPYKGLEVGRREAEVADEAVEAEIERLRERLAKLETVERAAGQGDFVVIDYVGSIGGEPFAGGDGRDQLVELGSGRLIEGMEAGLLGAVAGEERSLDVRFPDDYPATHLAGKDANFRVVVKEVRAKVLPELDDDLALEAAGLDTLQELREDIRARMADAEQARIAAEFQEAALDAAVAGATIEVPDALIDARAREMWERTLHALSHQGISREAYLRISGRSEDEVVAEARPEAEQALRRDAVIAAVVQAEAIEPSEEDLLEAVRPAAEREGTTPEKLLRRLERDGRLDGLREDLAARRAVELIAEQATPIPVERAAAREKLWTPDQGEGEEAAGGLWTPGG